LPLIRQWPLVGRSEELAVIAEATRASVDRSQVQASPGNAQILLLPDELAGRRPDIAGSFGPSEPPVQSLGSAGG
jgi:hypothetical protein